MSKFEDLVSVLLNEREILLRGRLAELSQLAERKEKLFQEVAESIAHEPAKIETIRTLSKSNSELFTAAGDGLKTALAQIGNAKNFNKTAIYGPSGAKTSIGSYPEKLEQKA